MVNVKRYVYFQYTPKIGAPWANCATLAAVIVALPRAEHDGKRAVGAEVSAALVFASEDRASATGFRFMQVC